MAINETPKRLKPRPVTLRELFLLSGNRCAFPGCEHAVINEDGAFIAEVCHIEGALPGGERFNSEMDNEARRAAANLLLLCHEHHVVTDDESLFDVARMHAIKRDHEARFMAGVAALVRSVQDWTDSSVITPATSLRGFHLHMGWGGPSDRGELDRSLQALQEFADVLRTLSLPARELLYIAVKRGRLAGGFIGVHAAELEDVAHVTPFELRGLVGQLKEQGLAYFDGDEDPEFWDFTAPYVAVICRDYPSWADLRSFLDDGGLRRLIVDLRFDLLDDERY
ncbi:hypothetical protein [Pseudonocardia yunnanensis]|uniref:HNH endonuclease n=1 Tax=Pseudonocardia yunnanensis TaxID=58107 RepID=A0ABW4FC20_9PSEU